ncbi:MAG: hypothetical protein WKG07_08425 [Hymenobacter sp.]
MQVPNPDSLDAQHCREYWAAYDVPRHLYHCAGHHAPAAGRPRPARDANPPLPLDAYYVSMLSSSCGRRARRRAGWRCCGRASAQSVRRAARWAIFSLLYVAQRG